ncbi:MAG: hypothetical protein V9E98_12295 [Candidatus Nanopelagicales bacterium]
MAGHRMREDSGVALVATMGLVMMVAILMITIAAFALREARQSGQDRQRSSSVMSAEGQVDITLAKIQGTARESLPCDDTVTQTEAQPDAISVQTVVTYFDGEAAATCEDVRSGAVTVDRALIKSTATSAAVADTRPAQRTVEVLVNMNPTMENGLDKAIFGNTGITLANRAQVFGRDGAADADLYTNGNFVCSNNQQFFGSVVAQGSICWVQHVHVRSRRLVTDRIHGVQSRCDREGESAGLRRQRVDRAKRQSEWSRTSQWIDLVGRDLPQRREVLPLFAS